MKSLVQREAALIRLPIQKEKEIIALIKRKRERERERKAVLERERNIASMKVYECMRERKKRFLLKKRIQSFKERIRSNYRAFAIENLFFSFCFFN